MKELVILQACESLIKSKEKKAGHFILQAGIALVP
jgi:hypothetical protein